MKTLAVSLFAAFFAAAALPACKQSAKDTGFSSGGKTAKRKPGNFDRSKAADITSTSAPANAVTRGSFTVWTEPKDPGPGQDYQVFIEAKLPANVSTLQQNDLSGKVIGTDGYEQEFGSGQGGCGGESGNIEPSDESLDQEPSIKSTKDNLNLIEAKKNPLNLAGCDAGFEDFNFQPGRARLSVWVPGGSDKVKDTINVTSAVLKENQSIAIEF